MKYLLIFSLFFSFSGAKKFKKGNFDIACALSKVLTRKICFQISKVEILP
jgi:hypothetical protein